MKTMTSAFGWYGPLIDLSKAASHIGQFVQLVVFVHRCTPVQYKLARGGGELVRTDIQVGDETLPFFSVCLWQKQMSSLAVIGDVILLQNVKITKFGCVVEGSTVQFSSLHRLVHPYEALLSKDVHELIGDCQVGKITIDKLVKVIKWVQTSGASLLNFRSNTFQRQLPRNWKVPEQIESQDFVLLSDVSRLKNSCNAIFNAYVGEILLPITWKALGDSEKKSMSVSRRITKVDGDNLVEDFTCTGCPLCGSPLESDAECMLKNPSVPLFCTKSSDHLHVIGSIYRPFMLYVWDESEQLPLLVKNKAAELLFGNIKAEAVRSCYRRQKHDKNCDTENHCREVFPGPTPKAVEGSRPSGVEEGKSFGKHRCGKNVDLHLIWLILLKLLLQQGKNSRLKFEVIVRAGLDSENGKFEMVSLSAPCFTVSKILDFRSS